MDIRRRIGLSMMFVVGLSFLTGGIFFLFVSSSIFGSGENDPVLITVFMGAVFAIVGLATLLNLPRLHKALRSQREAQTTYPGQQWMWREDWVSREIHSTAKSGLGGIWAFALFWNGLIAVVYSALWDQISETPIGIEHLVIFLFPLVGIFLFLLAGRRTLHWKKFGNSFLKIPSIPIPLGGVLAGFLHCPRALEEASGVILRLQCSRVTHNSDNSTSSILFQRESRIDRSAFSVGYDGFIVPVELPVPIDSEESDIEGGTVTIHWTLEVRAEVPGVDFSASFEVPVYGKLENQTTPISDPHNILKSGREEYKVRIEPTDSGGTRISFSAMRNPMASLVLVFFVVFWTFFLVLMVEHDTPLFFQIAWGTIDLAMIIGVVQMTFGYSWVQIEGDQITSTRGLLGLRRTKRLITSEITRVFIEGGVQVGNKVYHVLRLQTKNGKRITLGTGVRDRNEAEWIVLNIEKALGN